MLEPIELLARIAALIPPPRHPFMRYHGVLAPSAKWRGLIVPRLDDASSRAPSHESPPPPSPVPLPPVVITGATNSTPAAQPIPSALTRAPWASSTASGSRGRQRYARITAAHRGRVDGGALLASRPRLDWAKLLRRTFAEDVLTCPRCTGRARVIAALLDPVEAQRFITSIDEPSLPRSLPHARRQLDERDDFAPDSADPGCADDDDDNYEPQPPPASEPALSPPDD